MLIEADEGDKVTPGNGVPGNDKVTLADSESSKMDSVIAIGRVNVFRVGPKVITNMSIVPIRIVVHTVKN